MFEGFYTIKLNNFFLWPGFTRDVLEGSVKCRYLSEVESRLEERDLCQILNIKLTGKCVCESIPILVKRVTVSVERIETKLLSSFEPLYCFLFVSL